MTTLINCQRCHEKREPAVRHAIFCGPCWQAIEAEMDKPQPVVVNVFARKDGSIYDD